MNDKKFYFKIEMFLLKLNTFHFKKVIDVNKISKGGKDMDEIQSRNMIV